MSEASWPRYRDREHAGRMTLKLWHVAAVGAGLLTAAVAAIAAPAATAGAVFVGTSFVVAACFQISFRLEAGRGALSVAKAFAGRLLLDRRGRETISRAGWYAALLGFSALLGVLVSHLGG